MRSIRFIISSCALTLACGAPQRPQTPPEPGAHSLSGLAAQHIAVLPSYSVRLMPGLTWVSSVGRPADVQRTLDADILEAMDEHGLKKTWLFPADLEQAFKRNPTYAPDPYSLALEPLRSPSLAIAQRMPEPLASQIRTLVALHDNTRYVLAPVELRLEPAGSTGQGRGVLRLVLVDARLSNVLWIGEVSSDTVATFGPVVTAEIASKLANVIAVP